jgi:hypothetical protein
MNEEQLPAETDSIELEPDLPPGQEPEEGAPVKRFIKRTAVQQGSSIPTGWKPTAKKPIPVVRCHYIFKDSHARAGERCEQWSLRGSNLCYMHGGRGNLKNIETYRQSIIEAARLRLTEAVPDALQTLFDLAANSTADNVKLKAATEVLDRAGVKTAEQVEIDLHVTEASPAAALAERLDKLKKAADFIADQERKRTAARELEAAPDTTVIDAEIVEDD